MKNLKKIVLCVVCVALLVTIGALVFANAATEKTTTYEYALLGDVYTVGSGFVSGKTPTGEDISKDTTQITLNWAQGSYLLEYENKIVNLKVYESAPKDITTLSAEVPATMPAGLATVFPAMTVESGIVRTDGAPKVGGYDASVVFWFNGERVKTIRDVTVPVEFTPDQSGLWVCSYEYTDVFGRVRTVDYPFTVTDERIIVSTVSQVYYVGNTMSPTLFYGYFNGKRYAPTISILEPDGNIVSVSGSYIFSKIGKYTVTASAEMEGQTVENQYELDVRAGLQSVLTNISGLKLGQAAPNHSNLEALTDGADGLLMDMTASAASFTYNGIINLNDLNKETPVISFSPNHSYGGSISKVTVTLTDVYDSTNVVTITFTRNSDMTAKAVSYDNTLVRVTYGGSTATIPNYGPLQDDSVAWSTSFHNFWRSESHTDPDKTYEPITQGFAMNFSFDVKTATVYCYGQHHLVEYGGKTPPAGYPEGSSVTWYPVANLNDPMMVKKFEGFTTGEVYLNVSVDAGRGDLMLHSIGGSTVDTVSEMYGTDAGILLGSFDGTLPAAIGVPYKLPAVQNPYISNVTCKVIFQGSEVPIDGDSFTAQQEGLYTVRYEGVNQYGQTVVRNVKVQAIEKPELTISYAAEDVTIGSIYTVKAPVVSGYGDIAYTITVNGKQYKAGDRLLVDREMSIVISAKDALDTKESTVKLNVSKDYVSFKVDFPRTAVCGASFTFPKAEIHDYLSDTNLDYEIYVDGVKQGESMTLPAEKGTVNVEYRTARGSKTYILNVKTGEVATGGDALLLPSGATAQTNDAGTVITVTKDAPVVSMPYMLGVTGLPYQFAVLEENLNFDAMTIRLTDRNGTAITMSVHGLKSEQPMLYVNGADTFVRVSKQAATYTSGTYEGKVYYTYSLEYHDLYSAVLINGKIQHLVDKAENGVVFDGFDGGVYMDMWPEGIDGTTAQFIITQVSNQYFYASAFEYGDVVGPVVSTKDFMVGNNNVLSGYVLKVSDIKVFDVLTGSSSVKIYLIAPDGTALFSDVDPAGQADVTLDKVGIYTMKVLANDGGTGNLNASYRFTVEDMTAPEINISGNVPADAALGSTVSLPGAVAKDESAVTIRILVLAPNGEIMIFDEDKSDVSAQSFVANEGGSYIIRYIAVDERGNTFTQGFTVNVR